MEGLKQTPLPLNQLAAPSRFVYSTANDMAKFISHIVGGKSDTLIHSCSLKEMLNPHVRVCSEWEREGIQHIMGMAFL
mgnify:CR=1 FL=1